MAIELYHREHFPVNMPFLVDETLPAGTDTSLLQGPVPLLAAWEWYWKSRWWTPAGTLTAAPINLSSTSGTNKRTITYTGGTVTIPSSPVDFDLAYQQLTFKNPAQRVHYQGPFGIRTQVGINGQWNAAGGTGTVYLRLFSSPFRPRTPSVLDDTFFMYKDADGRLSFPIECLFTVINLGSWNITNQNTVTGVITSSANYDPAPVHIGLNAGVPLIFPSAGIPVDIDGHSIAGYAWSENAGMVDGSGQLLYPAVSGSLSFTREDW